MQDLYDDVKILVFCSEPWKLLGTQAIAINEKIQYALVKCTYKEQDKEEMVIEYLILAEKRISEFMARAHYTGTGKKQQQFQMKTLLIIPGEQLKGVIVKHPLVAGRISIPTVVFNQVTSTYGTGINAVVPGHEVEGLKIA